MSDEFRLLRPEDWPVLSDVIDLARGAPAMRADEPDEVTFTISLPGSGDGCILGISNYCLRRVPSPGPTLRAMAERLPLVLCLGEVAQVFSRVDAATLALNEVLFAELCSETGESPSEPQTPEEFERQKRKEALAQTWLEELRVPEVSRVATCHLYLAKRDRCAYGIAKCPWPPRTRPFQVVRLVDESFEPRGTPATLAYADPAGDAWIVTRFSWCGVEMSGPPDSRVAELLKEGFAAMTAGFGELKGMSAETLRHVADMRSHVEGVPPLVERAAEALADPLAAADEARRRMPLTRKEHEIRDAVIKHGTQKAAAEALGMSEATISRRMVEIRRMMKAAGFPDAIVFRPSDIHRRHVRKSDRAGMEDEENIEAPMSDWRDDVADMESAVRFYLDPNRSEAEREEMRREYPDIEAEVEEFRRQGRE